MLRPKAFQVTVVSLDVEVVLAASSGVLAARLDALGLEVGLAEALRRDGRDALKPNWLFNRLLQQVVIVKCHRQLIKVSPSRNFNQL